ncbi:MAG: hypothetical protein SGPRY_005172, partial [Prymnesium sp.]
MLGIPELLRDPLQLTLQAAGWKVKCCGEDTCKAREELQLASVLLVGERRPDLVAAQWVRDRCIILDLGLSNCAAPTSVHEEITEFAKAPAVDKNLVKHRAVRCLCCSDGLSAMTAALRMRNASHISLMHQ